MIAEGAILLPLIIGEALYQVMSMVDFLIVDYPSVYNMTLRRPFLNSIMVVTSTYALVIKF